MSLWKGFSGSSVWESSGLELMNQETWSAFSFLKLFFVFIHKVCLNCLPWGADWGAGSGSQSHTSCSREEALCQRLRLLLHLSIASWSSHEVRIVDQRENYGTLLIIVTVELVYAFIDIMRPDSKKKGVSNLAGQCNFFHVGLIFIPLCLFLVGPATVSWKTYKCPRTYFQTLFQSYATPLLPFEQTSKYLLLK